MATAARKVTLGLIQGKAEETPRLALESTEAHIREAAAGGAHIICLQELFLTPYFCKREEVALFALAEPVPGPTTERLAQLAGELGVVVVASLFEKRAPGLYHNTAAIIDADGSYLGKYRKMHIPDDPGYYEKFYFTPGDLGYRVWDTRFGRIGVLVCWDQWFPEAARLTALQGAEILFYPTAIGWHLHEKETFGKAQHTAWETIQRGHAVANGCYVAAVNRVGLEESVQFFGGSFVADPHGQLLAKGSSDREEILLVECDLGYLDDVRCNWPFFRDRRIETYAGLQKRFLDEPGER
ncbi:MAG: acyltransferase [Puniceicoccaceae bacterium]|nr:MAG: acyltransferase [Puniceicoccaceae bacterium]